jgi:hypothetical protein
MFSRLSSRLSMALVAAFSLVVARQAEAATNSAFAAAIASITDDDLHRHVEVLADDTFEGRSAGTRGGRAAGRYLLDQLKAEGATPGGENGDYIQSFNDNQRNILATATGDDPDLAKELIVVGAHYDHVGYGKPSNSYGPFGKIHNGADDNASGTSLLLELVQAFTQSGLKTRRSILFAFWDGEENGLVGSRYWVSHPTVPLENVKFNITMDMVGRLRDEHLQVLGTRSGYGARRLFCDVVEEPLWLDFSWEIKSDSDHWPFLERGIPIALIHTGMHSDYHRPSDDVEKINAAGMREVGQYLLAALIKVANEDQLPKFRGAVRRENDGLRKKLEERLPKASLANWPENLPRPRLGITWREDEAEPRSVFLVRVVEGTPGHAAGLLVGDRINAIDDAPFADGDALRSAINSQIDAGQPDIKFLVERRGHERTVVVNMPSDPKPAAE